MIPAHQLASRETRCVWLNPDQAIQIGSGSVLHNKIHAFFGRRKNGTKTDTGSRIWRIRSGPILLTGRNLTLPDRIHVYWDYYDAICTVRADRRLHKESAQYQSGCANELNAVKP